MTDDIHYSKKGERKLSQFIAHELLYDYVLDDLDDERRSAVESFISENREARMDLNRIKRGKEYCEMLSQTKASQELVERIQKPSSYLQLLLDQIKFDEWPLGIRLGLESVLVAGIITGIAIVVPWHKLVHLRWSDSSEVVLTEVAKEKSVFPFEIAESEVSADSKPKDEVFLDEGIPESELKELAKKTASSTTTSSSTSTSTSSSSTSSSTTTSSTTATIPPKTALAVVPTTSSTSTTTTKLQPQAEPAVSERPVGIGYLYRGSMRVSNALMISDKIKEGLVKLGGRKAGEVELGWKRGSGSYFHFTIPEARLEEVKALFSEFGNLDLSKEKHERVMPEGIIRMIITVDEAKK